MKAVVNGNGKRKFNDVFSQARRSLPSSGSAASPYATFHAKGAGFRFCKNDGGS
jgi:hypothetical protein